MGSGVAGFVALIGKNESFVEEETGVLASLG